MANASPHQARQAKRRRVAAAGTAEDLQGLLWTAIERAAALTGHADPATQLKAIHAVSQASASYTKLLELVEFDARLRTIESAQAKELAL